MLAWVGGDVELGRRFGWRAPLWYELPAAIVPPQGVPGQHGILQVPICWFRPWKGRWLTFSCVRPSNVLGFGLRGNQIKNWYLGQRI